jgi:hypothetical protein
LPGYESITPTHTTNITPNQLSIINTFFLLYISTTPLQHLKGKRRRREKNLAMEPAYPFSNRSPLEFARRVLEVEESTYIVKIRNKLALKSTQTALLVHKGSAMEI